MKEHKIGYIEYGVGNKIYKKKIKLPHPRYHFGIAKWREGYVDLGWFEKNPDRYGYGTYRHKIVPISKKAEWIRLRIGKRVVEKQG